ncbi:MAG: AzlD domain-containing protein [Pseudomonadota bacterium]
MMLAILLAGAGTYLSRALFIVALADRQFPKLALRALEYVAPCVMAALIVTLLTGNDGVVHIGTPEVLGLSGAAAVIWRTRNHVYALGVGMGVFWLVRALI